MNKIYISGMLNIPTLAIQDDPELSHYGWLMAEAPTRGGWVSLVDLSKLNQWLVMKLSERDTDHIQEYMVADNEARIGVSLPQVSMEDLPKFAYNTLMTYIRTRLQSYRSSKALGIAATCTAELREEIKASLREEVRAEVMSELQLPKMIAVTTHLADSAVAEFQESTRPSRMPLMPAPRLRTTYTVAELPISESAYNEIRGILEDVGYGHVFMDNNMIDMSGIALSAIQPEVPK